MAARRGGGKAGRGLRGKYGSGKKDRSEGRKMGEGDTRLGAKKVKEKREGRQGHRRR